MCGARVKPFLQRDLRDFLFVEEEKRRGELVLVSELGFRIFLTGEREKREKKREKKESESRSTYCRSREDVPKTQTSLYVLQLWSTTTTTTLILLLFIVALLPVVVGVDFSGVVRNGVLSPMRHNDWRLNAPSTDCSWLAGS